METSDFIEIDSYERGIWVTRRYRLSVAAAMAEQILENLPREIALGLIQRIGAKFGAPGFAQQEPTREDRLRVFVE